MNSVFVFFYVIQIKELINTYIVESNGGAYDYVRALADFTSRDENMLKFRLDIFYRGEAVRSVDHKVIGHTYGQ